MIHAADISSPAMEFADFKSQGLRVTQEFKDQYESEIEHPDLKENPPMPSLKWTDYQGFISSQIFFSSKALKV